MSFGMQYNLFDDLHELQQMVNGLERYLKSDVLYGSVGGGILTGLSSAQLTVGAVLLRLRRIDALRGQLNDKQRAQLHQSRQKHDEVVHRHKDAYAAKLQREATSRLNAMHEFFAECSQQPALCPRIYNPEVLRRTITQEIVLYMDEARLGSAELDKLLKKTDQLLRRYIAPSEFVWDEQLKPIYEPSVFWWMYMAPPPPHRDAD